MIVEWALTVVSAVMKGMLDLIPDVAVPGWLTDAGGLFGTLVGYTTSLSSWAPITLGAAIGGLLLASLAISFLIKVVRIVISFVTFGGGSAG